MPVGLLSEIPAADINARDLMAEIHKWRSTRLNMAPIRG